MSVAKSKDLYVYWREKVTQYLVEDAKEGPGPESSDTSLGKKFLVVNVASEEVGDRTSTGSAACVVFCLDVLLMFCGGNVVACMMSGHVFVFLECYCTARQCLVML